MPQQPAAGPGQLSTVQPVALVRAGGEQGRLEGIERRFIQPFHQPQREVRAHARTQHLGRPQQRRALDGGDLREAEGGGTSEDGADVAGILHAVEYHRGSVELQAWGLRQGEDAAHAFG